MGDLKRLNMRAIAQHISAYGRLYATSPTLWERHNHQPKRPRRKAFDNSRGLFVA